MRLKKIYILGESGQLASCFASVKREFPNLDLQFFGRDQIDFERPLDPQFNWNLPPDWIINTVAYTAVDLAETEHELNWRVNAEALLELSNWCEKHNTPLIHFSTDYVFDGENQVLGGYTEVSAVNPQCEYGRAKLQGEMHASRYAKALIFRIAWLYSQFGKNFYSTISTKIKAGENLCVVNDQLGCPTSGMALAYDILDFIRQTEVDDVEFGLYHYSHEGKISWYDFAVAIQEELKCEVEIESISSDQLKMAAKRPKFSALNSNLAEQIFQFPNREWRRELQDIIRE